MENWGSHSTQASSDASEIEWQESALPINYRLEYGAPSIATMGSRGRSIAVASSRGLCILECSPIKWKKLDKERSYLLPEYVREPGDEKKTGSIPSRKGGAVFNLPPKWHLFGNEMEEKSFRVIAMAWWEGIESTIDDHHLCDDLLIAIIQLHYKEDQGSTSGAYYLACWSQRR